jgi:hypothetical protein
MVTLSNRTKRKDRSKGYPRGYTNKNDIIAIDADSLDEEKNRVYICLYCRRDIIRISDEEYYCNNCEIPFWPIKQPLREKQKLTTPEGVNTETLVSIIPDDPNEGFSTTYGKPIKVRGGLKELENRGIKIKNYRETDGAGRTIAHRRDDGEEDE